MTAEAPVGFVRSLRPLSGLSDRTNRGSGR